MNDVLFKTNPRLIIIGTFFTGFIFFLLIALLALQKANGEYAIFGYSFFGLFTVLAFFCFYYLLKVKILIMKKKEIIVEDFLLPKKRQIKLEEIKNIKQKEELIKFYLGTNIFKKPSLFVNYKTNLELMNGEKIELISVTPLQFISLEKIFFKLKMGKENIKRQRQEFTLYILENGLAIIGLFFLNLLNIALFYGIISS